MALLGGHPVCRTRTHLIDLLDQHVLVRLFVSIMLSLTGTTPWFASGNPLCLVILLYLLFLSLHRLLDQMKTEKLYYSSKETTKSTEQAHLAVTRRLVRRTR